MAFSARFNVDVEHPFEPLCPGHRCPVLSGRLVIVRFGLFAAPHRRRYQRPILAVGGKYTVITGEIDPGPGHQGDQPGDEVQRLENHVGGAVVDRVEKGAITTGLSRQ